MAQYLKFPQAVAGTVTEGEKRFAEFKRLLTNNWQTVTAFPNLWFVVIDKIPDTIMGMNGDHIVNKEGPNQYRQESQNQTDLMEVGNNGIGCLLAQGIVTPQLRVESDRPVIGENSQGGYYSAPIITSINEPEELRIEFRETNTSFGDLIIKPWIELVAKNGLIARNPISDPRYIKCTIQFIELGLVGVGTEPVHRKTWTFYNAAPLSIVGTQHSHDDHRQVMLRDVNWTYTHWQIDDVVYDEMNMKYDKHHDNIQLKKQIRRIP